MVLAVFLLVFSAPMCTFTIIILFQALVAVVDAARKLVMTFTIERLHVVFFLQHFTAYITQSKSASVSFFVRMLTHHESTRSAFVNLDAVFLFELQSRVIPLLLLPE